MIDGGQCLQGSDSSDVSDAEMEDQPDPTADVNMGSQSVYCANQLSVSQYKAQAVQYTEACLLALTSSPEYQRVYMHCHVCWCVWSEGQFNDACPECGGGAMTRTCPVCQGRCGATWTRNVDMSHSENEAHWDGECLLPHDVKQGFLLQLTMQSTDGANLLEDMQDLSTQ